MKVFLIKHNICSFFRTLCIVLLYIILYLPALEAQIEDKTHEQITIDSLLNEAWSMGRSTPDKSLEIMRVIENINANMEVPYKEDVVYYYFGVFYKNFNNFSLSEEYFNKYEVYHEERNNVRRIAAVNMAKANLYSDIGNYAKSMEAVTKSLTHYESIKDTGGIISAGSKLGYLHTELGNFEEAINYHEKSIALSIATNNIEEEQFAYTNKALLLEKSKNYSEALKYYQKAYDIGEAKEGDYDKVLNRYNMANIYSLLGEHEISETYARACAGLADSINIPALSGASKRLLAGIYVDKGQAQKSLDLLLPLLDTIQYNFGLRDQIEVYGLLVESQKLKRDYVNAFQSLEILKVLSDSLLGLESRNRVNELSTLYETEKKEQQIALLALEREAAFAQISKKNRTILMIIIGLILVGGLSIFLFTLYKKYRSQKDRLASALEEKEYLIKEIHHRVKNNLQIISSLLQLQSRHLNEPNAIQALNDGESRVKSMAIIHQHLYTEDNLSHVNIPRYIDNLVINLRSSYHNPNLDMQIHQEIDDMALDVADMIPIGLIVNELITNSFKYAFQDRVVGNIWISIQSLSEGLHIEVKDDGIGMDKDMVSSGFGTRLINTFLKKLNATIDITTTNGTATSIFVPEYNTSMKQKMTA